MQVSLIFLPFFKLNIGSAVLGMVVFDVVGLIRGWKALNHVAHLGGGAIGAFYWQYGVRLPLPAERKRGSFDRG
jgi:rhomboid-like protein